MHGGTSDNVDVFDPEPGLLPPEEPVAAKVAKARARRANLTHLIRVVLKTQAKNGECGDRRGDRKERLPWESSSENGATSLCLFFLKKKALTKLSV